MKAASGVLLLLSSSFVQRRGFKTPKKHSGMGPRASAPAAGEGSWRQLSPARGLPAEQRMSWHYLQFFESFIFYVFLFCLFSA